MTNGNAPTNEVRESLDRYSLLTVNQVAERLGIHPQTVRQYIKNGDLGHVRFGDEHFGRRLMRVREDQLAYFIESHTA